MKLWKLIGAVVLALLPAAAMGQSGKVPVSTAKAATGSIEQVYDGLARVRPLLDAKASGQYDGRIVQILAQVGQKVTAGQALAQLSPRTVEQGTSSLVLGGAGYTVVANVSGVIVAQLQTVGDVVTAGTPIFSIVPETGFRITLSVPLAYAADVNYQSAATLHLPDGDLAAKPSSVQRFDLTGAGYFPVEFVVTGRSPVLGSVLDTSLVVRRRDQALVVPRKALVEKGGGFYVFVVSGGKAVQTQVGVGIRTPDSVEITSGLNAGDVVVTTGNYALEDGVEIAVAAGG